VPAHWTDEQAAAFPVNYFPAYLAYWQVGMTSQPMWGQAPSPVRRSEAPPRVLIHAAAGGVGTAAVQIGRILGVEMYGTSSSDDKLARVKELGLQHGINYKQHDYEEVVKNLTHGEGVDAVFEMLGGEHTAKSLRCLRALGRLIQYGPATVTQPPPPRGNWLTSRSQKPEIMPPAWQQPSNWIEQKKQTPQTGQVFRLSEA